MDLQKRKPTSSIVARATRIKGTNNELTGDLSVDTCNRNRGFTRQETLPLFSIPRAPFPPRAAARLTGSGGSMVLRGH